MSARTDAEPAGSDGELYRYMLSVARANGFDSLTDAITRAVRAEAALQAVSDDATDGEEFTTMSDDFIIRGYVLRRVRAALARTESKP